MYRERKIYLWFDDEQTFGKITTLNIVLESRNVYANRCREKREIVKLRCIC